MVDIEVRTQRVLGVLTGAALLYTGHWVWAVIFWIVSIFTCQEVYYAKIFPNTISEEDIIKVNKGESE
jgi:hypothetical protein